MSTVQDILDLMQYRLDYQGDLYHLINQSVRLIAKRLYWMKSGILKSDLALALPGEYSYTANTISFDASVSPNVINDSASGFITAGLTAGHYFTTTGTGNGGPFTMSTVVADKITVLPSDALVTATDGDDVTITMNNEYVNLPSDFWGMDNGTEDDLYIDGRQWVIYPLPNRMTALLYPGSGQPVYYEIIGTRFYTYPPADVPMTIKGRYFSRPAILTVLTDTIPFNEEFDDVIADYTVAAYKGEPMKTLQGMIYDAVDIVIANRDKSIPAEPKDVMEWGRLERGW